MVLKLLMINPVLFLSNSLILIKVIDEIDINTSDFVRASSVKFRTSYTIVTLIDTESVVYPLIFLYKSIPL